MKTPTVSAVIVNWNGLRYLRDCLVSLQQLRLPPAEIILVDNASSDGSVAFVQQHFPEVRLLVNSSNLGFAAPHEEAASAAHGDLLFFLNNDMRAHREALACSIPLFEQGNLAAVGLRILDWEGKRIDFDGASLQYLGYATQKGIGEPYSEVAASPRPELFACGGAMLVRRAVFRELGGFDADFFAIYEDVDFGWRAWNSGWKVLLNPAALAYHHGHGTLGQQASEKVRYLMHRNALLTILKNYEQQNLERVLPAAILLSIKRALEISGVDRSDFYLWASQRESLQQNPEETVRQCRDALNHLVAFDDVLTRMDYWLKKRSTVQSLRRRSDSEVLSLFAEPLRIIMERAGYMESEWQLARLSGLNQIFRYDAVYEQQLATQMENKLFDLRERIKLAEDTLERLNARLRRAAGQSATPIQLPRVFTSGVLYRLRRLLSRPS